jgi:hypothetical protein
VLIADGENLGFGGDLFAQPDRRRKVEKSASP